jgi:broad specificity phosphatase PhoE
MNERQRTVLFFVRHGQSEANEQEIISGHLDSPLTAKGVQQARALAEGMRLLEFDAVYTSTLQRARQSCEIVLGARPLQPLILESLREQDFGDWEGASYKSARADDPDAFAGFKIDPIRARAPDGESLGEFVERVRNVMFEEILAQQCGRRVLIVAHGGVIRVALNLLLRFDMQEHFYRFDIQNATLSIVRYAEQEGRLIALGILDPSHLWI